MNLQLMAAALRDIEALQPALDWLKQYGGQLGPERPASFSVGISLFAASACPGSKEAASQIEAMIRLRIYDLVQHAITDAENTIALRREQIAREAANG